MKVKEALKILQTLNPEADIILSADSEGNYYDHLKDIETNSIYYIEQVYSLDWSHEDAGMDKQQWEKLKKKPRCVILYP